MAMHRRPGAVMSAAREYLGPPVLRSVARGLDAATDGFAMSYADTQPFTERSQEGQAFLATNVAFALAGACFAQSGEVLPSACIDLAGALSVWYHGAQLRYGPESPEVRLALLCDYAGAAATAATCAALFADGRGSSETALLTAGAVGCLCAGWRFDAPRQYFALHGGWHVLGAAAIATLAAPP